NMGHQARLVAVHHGMTEVWSNQYRKWVLMDAELNHHFERDGVPLNMGELREIFHDPSPDRVRVVQGEQTSGDASTTMVHLKVAELDPESGVAWFAGPLHLVDLRNDWMTNRYFRGHP